jgi:hypothetical protein
MQDLKAGIIESTSFVNPLEMGFTTNSTLYAIEYQLTLRAYLSGAKDLVSSQPIHICPWGSAACSQIMQSIQKAAGTVNRRVSYPQDMFTMNNRGKRILVE